MRCLLSPLTFTEAEKLLLTIRVLVIVILVAMLFSHDTTLSILLHVLSSFLVALLHILMLRLHNRVGRLEPTGRIEIFGLLFLLCLRLKCLCFGHILH